MKALKREPDLYIGGRENPYLLRWYVIPKNPVFNIYLHNFRRSDDDRALHDHPWLFNVSILLKGEYFEHVPADKKRWPEDLSTVRKHRRPGAVYFRPSRAPHRVELPRFALEDRKGNYNMKEIPCWTLFITGPRVREWGFYCQQGWIFWKKFVSNRPGVSEVGAGCDQ